MTSLFRTLRSLIARTLPTDPTIAIVAKRLGAETIGPNVEAILHGQAVLFMRNDDGSYEARAKGPPTNVRIVNERGRGVRLGDPAFDQHFEVGAVDVDHLCALPADARALWLELKERTPAPPWFDGRRLHVPVDPGDAVQVEPLMRLVARTMRAIHEIQPGRDGLLLAYRRETARDVRDHIAWWLLRHHESSAEIVRVAEEIVNETTDKKLRMWAATLTGNRGVAMPGALAFFEQERRPDPTGHALAALAFAQFGHEDAERHLLDALSYPVPLLPHTLLEALARVGTSASIPRLKRIADKAPELNGTALGAVERIQARATVEGARGALALADVEGGGLSISDRDGAVSLANPKD